jgi:arginine:ornithine antiporter/lysine permease
LFLIITLVSNATYQALISLATSMILIPYLFSAVYATRVAIAGENYAAGDPARGRDMLIGALATVYCCWLLYAAGPKFRPFEAAILAALVVLAAIAAWLLSSGALGL